MRKKEKFIEADFIGEKIYLGGEESAINLNWLKKNNITNILIVAQRCEILFQNEIIYKVIEIDDDPQENIEVYFDECFKFIDGSLGNVLIHCVSGISRSSTIVIAYLMKKWNKNFQEVFSHVKKQRNQVNPNSGFKM